MLYSHGLCRKAFDLRHSLPKWLFPSTNRSKGVIKNSHAVFGAHSLNAQCRRNRQDASTLHRATDPWSRSVVL
jgi:hypothetical protein